MRLRTFLTLRRINEFRNTFHSFSNLHADASKYNSLKTDSPDIAGSKTTEADPTPTTHFGFKTIPKDKKESLVASVFSSVAPSYDVMNDAMSFGIHRLWKDVFIQRLGAGPGTKLIDVAGGTGDIAFRFLQSITSPSSPSEERPFVHVIDINPEMLDEGKKKARQLGFISEDLIRFDVGNAESLSNIESESMDAYTIAFGIRNCTHIDRVLAEAYRILKPGGRFMCLEFSHVENPMLKQLYDLYSFQVIPVMGKVIANDEPSYQYLVESIRKFPDQKNFAEMIRKAGFKFVSWENLTFGVAAIHSGFKV